MNAVTGTLPVPGARLHYEVRGTGPLLLLIAGGNSDAAIFEGLADALADRHRVVSYDARGYSRSPLDGPPRDQHVGTHADDAYRLLTHLAAPGETPHVFGGCSGGLVALDLAARRPGSVGAVVAHEPPAMPLLPDAPEHIALFDAAHAAYLREGVGPALRVLSAAFGGRPAPALPEARDNSAFFLAHVVRTFARYRPDVAALRARADRIAIGSGLDSRDLAVHRPTPVLARLLGGEPYDFPGGHVGWVRRPVAFADRLTEVLDLLRR